MVLPSLVYIPEISIISRQENTWSVSHNDCRGKTPLSLSGKSHGFSLVASRTWGIFTSYGGDAHLKPVCVQQCQDACLVTMDTSGF